MKESSSQPLPIMAAIVVVLGFFDSVPILSQFESLGRVICGDAEGARQCQINFSEVCPIVSQVNSVVHSAMGNDEKALKIQQTFVKAQIDNIGSTPVIGFGASAIAAATGNTELAKDLAKSCAKSSMMAIAGAATIATGGVAGVALAAGAGVASSFACDGIITGVDSAIHGEYRPSGNLAAIQAVVEASNGEGNLAESIAGLAISVAGDGMAGMGTRTAAKKAHVEISKNSAVTKSVREARASGSTVTKKQAKSNLNRCIDETKMESKNLLGGRGEDKGKFVKSRPDGPVHCTMEGSGGTKGSGNSYNGRPGSKELSDAQKQRGKLRGEVAANDPRMKEIKKQCSDLEKAVNKRDSGLVDLHSHPSTGSSSGVTHRTGTSCAEPVAAKPILTNNEAVNTSSATRTGPSGQVYGARRCKGGKGKKGRVEPGCDTLNLGAVPTDYLDSMKLNPGTKKGIMMVGYYMDHENEDPSD